MGNPIKIISGGQTGVDRAALDVAIALNIECGGWCPPQRISEDGKIPEKYPLIETPKERSDDAPHIPRSLRTELNVRDADATLILMPTGILDPGTNWTLACTKKYKKEVLQIDPLDDMATQNILAWLNEKSPEILNIAGPGESVCRGIGSHVFEILLQVFNTNTGFEFEC